MDASGAMHEHRSRTLTSWASPRGATPDSPRQGAEVWVSQYAWDDGSHEDAVVLVELPTDGSCTQLGAAEARDLAEVLLEAADLLDGEGRTNCVPAHVDG